MVDKDRELDMRNKDKEREIEAIRIKTTKEKGVMNSDVSRESSGVGERLGTGQERREERRDERQENRQENRQEDRQENRQERRQERRDER